MVAAMECRQMTTAATPVMVAVFNHKGGVAKTTTACNLAVCLAAHGYRVVLVDLDTQGNATSSFGVSPLPAIGAYDVISGQADLAQAVLSTTYPNLWLLPATTSLRAAEADRAVAGQNHMLLRAGLERGGINGAADLVVVDCPPALGMLTTNALASANAVMMPVRPDPFAHEGLVNTWYEVRRIRESRNPGLGVAGILLTMTASELAGGDVSQTIRAEFGEQVYAVEVATDPRVAEAAQLGLPVCVLDPDCAAARGYLAAAEEMLARMARQNRPGTALPPAGTTDAALNVLREWRASIHGSLLRLPSRHRDLEGHGPTPLRLPDDEDDEFLPAPPRRWVGMATALLVGLACGMVLEASGGILAGLRKLAE
jgi:chromosome partitioning protein